MSVTLRKVLCPEDKIDEVVAREETMGLGVFVGNKVTHCVLAQFTTQNNLSQTIDDGRAQRGQNINMSLLLSIILAIIPHLKL